MEVHLGVRVVRGPDWEWGDQDGGEGHVGTVVEVGEPSVSDGGRAVVVQWDCGERCRYRCGVEGKYDLRGFDSAPADLYEDEGFYVCIGCGLRELEPGFYWSCCQCSCYVLCTSCYMAGKHNNHHTFWRIVYERQWGLVPKRKGAHLTEVKGIFPGATVMRGKDWSFGDEDGGHGGLGKVVAVGSSKDGKKLRDVAEVKWFSRSSKTTTCRLGHEGKVDLLCVSAAKAGLYYLEHLPALSGQPPEMDNPTICSEDLVEVELDVEIFRMMQEGHGGWGDGMDKLQGQVGFVHHISDSGDLLVNYPSGNWLLNPSAVVKILSPIFLQGDVVRITDDRKKAMKAQKSVGSEWNEDILDILGEEGINDGSDIYGVMSVIVKRKRWSLNRLCLELTGSRQIGREHIVDDLKDDPDLVSKLHSLLAERDPDVLAYAAQLGDEHVIREFLKNAPNEVNRIVDCKAPIHYAAKAGSVVVVKTLLEFQADVNILDDMLQSPLHFALLCLKIKTSGELVECLLEAGADPNIQNIAGETPLMIASRNCSYTALKVLAKCSKCDFNVTNLDGATALMTATFSQNVRSIKLLLDGGDDPSKPNTINSETVTPLHYAAKHGFSGAVEESIEYFPELVNLKDGDGKTPLHIAIANNHFHLATYLMETLNCDINTKDNSGNTPLDTAISEGNTYLIEQLIGYGADLNTTDESGCTPLNVLTFLDIAEVTIKFRPISSSTPELLKVQQIISNKDIEVYTVIACLLIQEGAHVSGLGLMGLSSSQTLAIGESINPAVMKIIRSFAENYSGTGHYHGSLKQSRSTTDLKTVAAEAKDSMSLPKTEVNSSTNESNLCELCEEEPITVRFHPCNHSVLCEVCAKRATKCLKCKIPITTKEKL